MADALLGPRLLFVCLFLLFFVFFLGGGYRLSISTLDTGRVDWLTVDWRLIS